MRRWLFGVLKVVVVTLVLLAVGRHVWKLAGEWTSPDSDLATFHLETGWMVMGAAAYSAGQICFGLFWGQLLRNGGVTVSRFATLRAYGIGTLGKYIPGKAWVVVLRTMLIRAGDGRRLRVGLSVLYETLACMGTGAVVAGVFLVLTRPFQWVFLAGAGAMAAALLGALHPAIFRWIGKLASLPFNGSQEECLSPPWRMTLRGGLPLQVIGWFLSGISVYASIRAMGVGDAGVHDLRVCTAVAGLSTAAGFLVIFMPAGIGVRELVIIQLLTPRIGPVQAVVASLLVRTVWTLAELVLAGVLWAAAPSVRRPAAADLPATRD